MFRDLMTYIDNRQFRMTFLKNRLNVVFYKEILVVEENRITLRYDEGYVTIFGNHLTINKLLEEELLITGEISKIELRG